MSVSLTVIPIRKDDIRPDSYTRMEFQGRYGLFFDELEEASSELPDGVLWYGDEGLRQRKTNPFGNPVLCVTADVFVQLWEENASSDNKWDWAIIAFIRELDEDQELYLWFH